MLQCTRPIKLIYVKKVDGKMKVSWPGDSGEIHTRLLEKMRDILFEEKVYPYLMPNAKQRIDVVRKLAKNTDIKDKILVPLGGSSWCLFPWLGTRSFRTILRYLKYHAKEWGLSDIQSERCYYITFKCQMNCAEELLSALREKIAREGVDTYELVGAGECPIYDKYDDYIPSDLLRMAYAEDRLDAEGVIERFLGETT